MSLDRFKTAQEDRASGFDAALAELKKGRKTSHWIWYIFPQLSSLGRSSTARFYGLSGLGEACDYLSDSVLRHRLVLATEVVDENLAQGASLLELMGSETDCFKLASSLTLFEVAAKKLQPVEPVEGGLDLKKLISLCERVLTLAGGQGFPRCSHTLQAVASIDGQ
jgi:uncharacterized protein (DUF1810 family)